MPDVWLVEKGAIDYDDSSCVIKAFTSGEAAEAYAEASAQMDDSGAPYCAYPMPVLETAPEVFCVWEGVVHKGVLTAIHGVGGDQAARLKSNFERGNISCVQYMWDGDQEPPGERHGQYKDVACLEIPETSEVTWVGGNNREAVIERLTELIKAALS